MESQRACGTDRPDLSGVTALVIDADVPSIELFRACLEPFGARVVSARSAREARQVIETITPDITICELVLPDQNGLEFVRWLRARRADQGGTIPAIAVTVFYERFGVREARAAGFDMFVRKPIDPMDIVHSVTLLLRRGSAS